MDTFFKIEFKEDDKGLIHIFTDMLNQDKDGYFLTTNQAKGMFMLLHELEKTIRDNDLESLK